VHRLAGQVEMMSASDASNLLGICIALLPSIPELSEVAGRLLSKAKGWSISVLEALADCENVDEVCHCTWHCNTHKLHLILRAVHF
jgi:hypothetical protein